MRKDDAVHDRISIFLHDIVKRHIATTQVKFWVDDAVMGMIILFYLPTPTHYFGAVYFDKRTVSGCTEP
jgi:hypothetical protein